MTSLEDRTAQASDDLLGLKGEGDDSCRQRGRGRGACVGVCALLPEVCGDLKQEAENISHHWYDGKIELFQRGAQYQHCPDMTMKSLTKDDKNIKRRHEAFFIISECFLRHINNVS